MKIGTILVWDAYATDTKRKPICLGAEDDLGLGVQVYHGKKGIRGVAVFDGPDLVGTIGRVPKSVTEES